LTPDPIYQIDDAVEADVPDILAMYNDVIATSTAVYSELPVTLENRQEWFRARVAQGYPVLVARDDTGVIGYATFGDFRAWPGYRFTVEHSVHIRADRRGQGIGTRLMQALLPRARALGKHVMIGGIDADNAASIRMHERLGFERSAHMKEVGRKFDRWLDLVFMQRTL
jgi:phosphinothricin acetyltransferase